MNMRINDNLNVYDDNDNSKTKIIYKSAIIIFAFLLLISIVLTIFFKEVYSSIIGILVGSVISVVLFNLIEKRINSTYYLDLKTQAKKIHIIHQITYICSFLIIILIFKDIFCVIGLTLGLLLIKMAIILSSFIFKDEPLN